MRARGECELASLEWLEYRYGLILALAGFVIRYHSGTDARLMTYNPNA